MKWAVLNIGFCCEPSQKEIYKYTAFFIELTQHNSNYPNLSTFLNLRYDKNLTLEEQKKHPPEIKSLNKSRSNNVS